MLENYTLDTKDFVPPTFKGGPLLKFFVTAKDLSFRAGWQQSDPGPNRTTFWYHELLYVQSGKVRYSCEPSRWSTERKTFEAGPGDVIYIQKGTTFTHETISDEPYVSFYVAVPAPSQAVEYEPFPETKPI